MDAVHPCSSVKNGVFFIDSAVMVLCAPKEVVVLGMTDSLWILSVFVMEVYFGLLNSEKMYIQDETLFTVIYRTNRANKYLTSYYRKEFPPLIGFEPMTSSYAS